ncbi:MAG: transcriptional repressor [Tannerellaceae bacterium]|jgi:Fur family ferric uptake transcriptional regulator|nr:transcriptional repressor [Tannerellaceae bacterium]
MDVATANELRRIFVTFLNERNFRLTKERNAIFEYVCEFVGHFELRQLQNKLEENVFHVSKSTLYTTLDILINAGILVKHPLTPIPLYELKRMADKHVHLFCIECCSLTDISVRSLRVDVRQLKFRKFTAYYHNVYIFGLCSKCAFRLRQEVESNRLKKRRHEC